MVERWKAAQVALGLMLFSSVSAQATVASFDVSNAFGNTWEHRSTVENLRMGMIRAVGPVAEPASAFILGIGLFGIGALVRRCPPS